MLYTSKAKVLGGRLAKIPAGRTLLASSDGIESVFGTYKAFTARSPLREIGQRVLMIPLFLTDLTQDLVRQALETIRTADVRRWVQAHIGLSLLAKRIHALSLPSEDTKTVCTLGAHGSVDLTAFSNCLRKEWNSREIRVTVLQPAGVNTWGDLEPDKLLRPNDVANLIRFTSS